MTSNDTDFLQSSEWRHVLAAYGRKGVSQACLLLQDALGVDVLVLLHLTYVCAQHHIPLPESEIQAADAAVKEWRRQVVQPLRAARRAISKEDSRARALRSSIQQAELVAEQYALEKLAARSVWTGEQDGSYAPSAVYRVAEFYALRNGCLEKLREVEFKHAIECLEQELFRT